MLYRPLNEVTFRLQAMLVHTSPRPRGQELNQFNQGGSHFFRAHHLSHVLGARCPDVSPQRYTLGNGLDSLSTLAMIRPCETSGAS